MSAETLRKAAALMRERAEPASPAPWVQNGQNGIHTTVGACIATTHSHNDDRRTVDAQHIASWHPAVAVAVADWLEVTADLLETHMLNGAPTPVGHAVSDPAVAAARAYLGEGA